MPTQFFNCLIARSLFKQLSLHMVVTIPLVLQALVAVGVMGYFPDNHDRHPVGEWMDQLHEAEVDQLARTERYLIQALNVSLFSKPLIQAGQAEPQLGRDNQPVALPDAIVLGLGGLLGSVMTWWVMQFRAQGKLDQTVQFWLDYTSQLERQVADRQAELDQMRQHLQQTIQDREQAEVALNQSQERLRLITDSVPAGIAYVDAERRYRFVNKAYETRFNRPREEILGQYVWDVIGLDTYSRVKETIDQVLQGERKSVEFDITYQTGKTSYISSILSPAFDEGQQVVGYYLVFFDITERKRLETSLKAVNDQLEHLATCDGLTQIANRRKFDEYLCHEWKRSVRTQGVISLILFDVDYFKRFNDTYGHQAGDLCLVQVAQAAKARVHRSVDLVARYGGEEFAVILPDTDQAGAIAIAQQLQQGIWELAIPHAQSEVSSVVTVSLGIASLVPTPESSPETLIALADQALYAAKQQGRDRWAVLSTP